MMCYRGFRFFYRYRFKPFYTSENCIPRKKNGSKTGEIQMFLSRIVWFSTEVSEPAVLRADGLR